MPAARPFTFDAHREATRLFYAAPIDQAARVDPSNPKWIQLCTAGRYVYRGQPVEITPATFDAMISNFRAHPAFSAAARGIFGKPLDEATKLGAAITSGVVALNFDHPPQGAPRPGHGWFLDVERRGEQLWGLCWFDAEAHAGMIAGTWKWTSIEWSEQAVDNKGQEIGPYLSGVALTNDPFIVGMTPIQMGRASDIARNGPVVLVFGPATDVLCELRALFALPETSSITEIVGEVAKLRAWALGELPPPIGVDVVGLVTELRRSLNLPTLAEPASIFAELDKLLARLSAEQPDEEPMPDPTKPTDQNAAVLGLARVFSAKLAARVGMTPPEDQMSFDALGTKYDAAMGHYQALSQMFQTTDAKEIASKLANLIALSEQVTSLLGEVKADHEAEEAAEGEMAAQDVAQVMSAQRMDPRQHRGTFEAYKAQRLGFAQPLQIPSADDVRKDPGKLIALFAQVRTRREQRGKARLGFFSAHGITDLARVQEALPAHLKGALAPALFAGNAALFGPGPQGQGAPGAAGGTTPAAGAPMGFGAFPGQQPFAPPAGPPAGPHTWTRARLAALPPAENDALRIVNEIVRTELNGAMPAPGTQAFANLHARSGQILFQLSRES